MASPVAEKSKIAKPDSIVEKLVDSPVIGDDGESAVKDPEENIHLKNILEDLPTKMLYSIVKNHM